MELPRSLLPILVAHVPPVKEHNASRRVRRVMFLWSFLQKEAKVLGLRGYCMARWRRETTMDGQVCMMRQEDGVAGQGRKRRVVLCAMQQRRADPRRQHTPSRFDLQ
ncbi:hypothetical protein H257_10494 [Aphanomyces astaci]|uniref:Uncharacterized protein n=1 Tax=Aphanomyces astaci TaxID=112090 RepID=W4G7P1_APHAT|nr:hypothetical protein H257_10494 [Aphanomyces astaci]ETV75311.1 hypothetical protein H257_10494 [Aphanomyces astaci]|eukprot:XP_009835359.1 hypothetical protein H257_10494 [Aphanomyces astaci]